MFVSDCLCMLECLLRRFKFNWVTLLYGKGLVYVHMWEGIKHLFTKYNEVTAHDFLIKCHKKIKIKSTYFMFINQFKWFTEKFTWKTTQKVI